MQRAKAQGEERVQLGMWSVARGKVLSPGPFFPSLFANEFQPPSLGTPPSGPCLTIAASRRHSIHDFTGFHLPFPEYQDGVAMEMSLAATCLANRLGGAAGMADFIVDGGPLP